MTRTPITLFDEQDKQTTQCQQLGADLYTDDLDVTDDEEEIAWGADPYLILAAREARGEH